MRHTTASHPISKPWKYTLILFSLAVLLLLAGWFWQHQQLVFAPDTVFATLRGERISLKKLHGKPVLVTFWATDCPSCVEEVNDFVMLYRQYHLQGLEIIAVAMAYDPPNHVVEMSRAKQIPYHVAIDLRSENAQAFGDIVATPTTFLISPAGQIVFSKIGRFDLSDMQQRLDQLLQGKR